MKEKKFYKPAPYYGPNKASQTFVKIPWLMFYEPYDGLSVHAKILYGLLLDRMAWRYRDPERWNDGEGAYVYYQREEIMQLLKITEKTATKLFNELEEIGLISRKREGFGKPAKIYIHEAATAYMEEPEKPEKNNPEEPTKPEEPEERETGKNSPYDHRGKNSLSIGGKIPPVKGGKIPPLPNKNKETDSLLSKSIYPAPAKPTKAGAKRKAEKATKKGKTEKATATDPTTAETEEPKKESPIILTEAPSDPYKAIFRRNLLYDNLEKEFGWQEADELINTLAEECADKSKTMRVGGKNFPRHWFKKEVLTMEPEHARRILYALRQIDPAKIHNRRAYLVTMCYNHKSTNWTPDEYAGDGAV